jgi:hypothetical protein
MPSETPQWLDLVRRVERALGVPIEKAVRTDTYFDLVTQAKRAQARFAQAFEGAQRDWLHLFNLPAHTDVRGLREQLARVERRLNEIGKELEDLGDAAEEDRQARLAELSQELADLEADARSGQS